ncbi:CyaY protein [Inhella inkyongensis]|uniref:Iron-sulfur cluster assembly protein CyaY n=1 Tax=Inhella inkyongensis TaxID=392593 RepID=A0A840S0I3_9BURK|nr:iron donor protein CyaY [Inhella inkyongensis]MBB5203293.1 CyaY protein [Inhella inkyongensis]
MTLSMTDSEYHAQADALLRRLETQMDRWLEDDVIDIDTQRAGGLLELSFPDRSKLVINKQPPLHEIWLASRAGGFHFRWVDMAWRDTKTAQTFEQVFDEQASRQAGRPLQLTA